MLEHLLVVTIAIVRATSNPIRSTPQLGKRLNCLNARRAVILERNAETLASNTGDIARAELIHYLGMVGETKLHRLI